MGFPLVFGFIYVQCRLFIGMSEAMLVTLNGDRTLLEGNRPSISVS